MDLSTINELAMPIWDRLVAFNMPIPDILWGGPLVLIILWLVMRDSDAKSVGSVDDMAREHQRVTRTLRNNKRQIERQKTMMRRQRRDAASF